MASILPQTLPLRHIKIPGITTYQHAAALQSVLFQLHLLYKAQQSKSSTPRDPNTPKVSKPPGYIITAQFQPVYTLGRREATESAPEGIRKLLKEGKAQLLYTPRGGKITFHGPGQIVAYPILDLKAYDLTPKCYIRFLETSIIKTLKGYDVDAFTTEEPGVWVREDRKIASIGVNLRRWVSSHGLGLNVSTDMGYFRKIIACGLEGVEMWSMEKDIEKKLSGFAGPQKDGVKSKVVPSVRDVERSLVMEIAEGLGCHDVQEMKEGEVWEIAKEFGLKEVDEGIVEVTEREIEELADGQKENL